MDSSLDVETLADMNQVSYTTSEVTFDQYGPDGKPRRVSMPVEVYDALRLRAALEAIANTPDPLEGKCYCRWSKGIARQALGSV